MRNRVWMISGLAAVAVLAAACGSSSSGTPSSTGTTPNGGSGSQTISLKTANTSLGVVVTDSRGFTLYWYAPDSSTTAKCTGACASTWPSLAGHPQAASGVSLTGALGTVVRPDGSTQATYAGHPLYLYVLDTGPGQTHGEGVGGVWRAVLASAGGAPAPSPSASSSGGGGYGY